MDGLEDLVSARETVRCSGLAPMHTLHPKIFSSVRVDPTTIGSRPHSDTIPSIIINAFPDFSP